MCWIFLKIVLSVLHVFEIHYKPVRKSALKMVVRAYSTLLDANELGQLPAGLLDYYHDLQMMIGRKVFWSQGGYIHF